MNSDQIKKLKQIAQNLDNLTKEYQVASNIENNLIQQTINEVPKQQQQSLIPSLQEFDQLVQQFKEAGVNLQVEQLLTTTNIVIDLFQNMKQIIEFSLQAQKPTESQMKEIQKIINQKSNKIFKVCSSNPDLQFHQKSILEGLVGILWVINDNSPKMSLDGAIESSEYHALKLKQQKKQDHTKWYNLFIESIKKIKIYMMKNFPNGLLWNENGINDYTSLYDLIKQEKQQDFDAQQQIPMIKPDQVVQQEQQLDQQQQLQNQQQPTISNVQLLQPPKQNTAYPSLNEFNELVQEFQKSSTILEIEELKDMTTIVLDSFDKMKAILEFSYQCQKPSELNMKEIQNYFMEVTKQINKHSNNDTIKFHYKAIADGINAVFWVLHEMPKDFINGCIESSEYQALKLKQQKIANNTAWYNNFIKCLKKLAIYSAQHFPKGLKWNEMGTTSYQVLINILQGKEVYQVQQAPQMLGINSQLDQQPPLLQQLPMITDLQLLQPPQILPEPPNLNLGPPPSLNLLMQNANFNLQQQASPQQDNSGGDSHSALFESINVGPEEIMKRLKKTNKNQQNESSQIQSATQQKKAKNSKAGIVQKDPKKYKKDNWFVENFQNSGLIEFQEGECEMKNSIFFDNCYNCVFKVNDKINKIILNKCEKCQIIFNQVVSSVETVNCIKIEITCIDKCPSIQVDKCEQIHVTLRGNRETEVVSSKTTELNITYPEEDDLAKDTPIPEQFITKWDEQLKKFITKPLDSFLI